MPDFILNLPPSVPVVSGSGVPDGQVDHAATAIARLPEQFKSKPNIEALLRCFLAPCQELEQAFQDLKLLRSVDTAEGVQLDVLGKVVGQPRNGVSDDELYRRYIRARIATNRSKGLIEDLIRISRLVIDDDALRVVVENVGIATVTVRAADITLPDDVAAIAYGFLSKAKSAGARLIFQYVSSAPAGLFAFDVGPGLDNGHLASQLG